MYKSALDIASSRTHFVSRVPGPSKQNPTVTLQERMYHKTDAFELATWMLPRFASVYIHDTEHPT